METSTVRIRSNLQDCGWWLWHTNGGKCWVQEPGELHCGNWRCDCELILSQTVLLMDAPVFLKPVLLFHSPLRFILQVQRTDSQACLSHPQVTTVVSFSCSLTVGPILVARFDVHVYRKLCSLFLHSFFFGLSFCTQFTDDSWLIVFSYFSHKSPSPVSLCLKYLIRWTISQRSSASSDLLKLFG